MEVYVNIQKLEDSACMEESKMFPNKANILQNFKLPYTVIIQFCT